MRVCCTAYDELADGTPGCVSAVERGCKRIFEVDDEMPGGLAWSVHTDADGNVIRHTASVQCPDCGKSTHVVRGLAADLVPEPG